MHRVQNHLRCGNLKIGTCNAVIPLDADAQDARSNVSVLIITYNEEACIASCLESVAWSDDIVVVDSHSTDATVEILRRFAAVRLYRRAFDDFSSQRNFGLHGVVFRNEWVLIIDADETCPEPLAREIRDKVRGAAPGVSAFRLRRDVHFLGAFLRHNSFHNVWLDRLVRPREVRYRGLLHEKLTYSGASRRLDGALCHYPYAKGIEHWLHRRNVYSSLAARAEFAGRRPLSLRAFLAEDPIKRREAWNAVFRRLPLRWLVLLLYNVFVSFCFLDGARGIYMVLLETYYEFTIVVKLKEQKEASRARKAAARRAAHLQEPPDGADSLHHDDLQHEVPALLRHRRAE